MNPTNCLINYRDFTVIFIFSDEILSECCFDFKSQFIDLNASFETGNYTNQHKVDRNQLVTNMLSSTASGGGNSASTGALSQRADVITSQRVKKPNTRLKKSVNNVNTANNAGKQRLSATNRNPQFSQAGTTQANNVSFDNNTNSTTSSTNNLSDLNGYTNAHDESASETSGRFTGASNTLNNEGSPNSTNSKNYKKVEQNRLG